MENNVKEIKIKIIEVKDVETVEGRKFKAFKTVDKHGDKMDVKFTQECQNVPKEPCTIVVDPMMANVSKKKIFPVLWIKGVLRIEKTERESNVFDYFGEEDELTPYPAVDEYGIPL